VKVLVVNNMAPFVRGGAESLAEHLLIHLQAAGHEAELLRIPFQWEPATRIPAQMLLARTLELWNADQVIALKFPAYLIPHPRKTLWLVHQYRQAYDLFDAGQTNLPDGQLGVDIRELIKNADDQCFQDARRIFAISDVTQQRLAHYNRVHAEILRAPINDPERFTGGVSQGYIFAGGRINAAKRQHLLVEAMAFASNDVRLVIGGPPDTSADADRLQEAVERLGLGDRVRLDLRYLDRQAYADYVNGALAVASLPFDEESYSYVAMEAATAEKPLLSTTDSGGVLGLARHGATGWVAEPSAQALAGAMSAAYGNASRAREYGRAAKSLWESKGINWAATVAALMS
jgi:glycosyltransferase involved in cell wall biosynthesis